MNPLHRSARRLASTVGLAAALLGLGAAPALAAPSYQVQMTRQASEFQVVFVKAATGGQFRLNFGSGGPGVSETGDLAYNAAPATVQTALNSLTNVNTGGGFVAVETAGPTGHFQITFSGGPLANTDVPQLSWKDGTTPLSGGGSRVVISTVYKAEVTRSDKQLDYTVNVKNSAAANTAPVTGDVLACAAEPPFRTWNGTPTPTFAYQWLRDGSPIGSATNVKYTVVGADNGHSLQCRVTGTNTTNTATSSAVVSGPVVVAPIPAITPPGPTAPTAASSRPTITPTTPTNAPAGTVLTCNNPASWAPLAPDPNAPTFTYQWLRNGSPIATATTSTYTVEAADAGKALQCEVLGSNGDGGVSSGGRAVGISSNRLTEGGATALSAANTPAAPAAQTPFITGRNDAFGPTTLEVELPAGESSFVQSGATGTGWSCTTAPPVGVTPAKATCTRAAEVLAPGASLPTLTVKSGLGANLADHAVAKATASGGGAAAASDLEEFDFTPARPFAFERFDSEVVGPNGSDYTQAGGHPFSAGIFFGLSTFYNGLRIPMETPRKVIVDLPRGLVGNALAVPVLCASVENVIASTCPSGSAVGEINVDVAIGTNFGAGIRMPIFSIVPELGAPAQFAFAELANIGTPFTITPRLRADDGYAISFDVTPAPVIPALRGLNEGVLCSFGAKVTGNTFNGCKEAGDATANQMPLSTNPTRCAGTPPTPKVSVDSWEHPGDFTSAEVTDPLNTGCEKVDFQPEVSLKPTNQQADTPTGVDVEITMPTDGLESNKGLAQSNLDNAIVTFPKGMSLNPAAAHGLGNCTPAQVKLGSNAEDECPLSSQVGTIEIDTPLIRETLTGHVFLASQLDNPLKSTLGIYLVFASKKDGVTIKVAGELKADPVTGQLTSSFVENPEAPFSRLAIKFNSGPRAPLVNPPKCGTYAIHSEMSPWSAASPANPTPEEIVSADSTYQVTSGPNGAPCPDGALDPKFEAGMTNAVAGSKSPFALRLHRDDGSKRFTGLNLDMPQGFTAYLKGIPYCPDHVLAGISSEELTGRPELASSACPAASQIGTIQAGAGAGPYPFYAQGRVFLAGPYKGAPLSMAVVGPAVAGPFDFGNVVVRNALYVDPITAKVSVVSDPIPTMLHGILLDIRDIRVNVNRPNFTASPTNCEEKSIDAHIGGEEGTNANRSNRFQVGDCASLGFEPKLNMRLFGGTKRGAHPKFRAILKPREGDANIAGASVALPHSEFLDQAHIRTVCTRVQFAAKACPAGSIYGHAEATSPLLDNPVTGPVYLRSSSHQLPDLVVALRGPDSQPIEVQLAGRVDSVNGGIRSTFELVPDQPVSSFVLTMQGGKKGLLVNSRDLCQGPAAKATAVFLGQNGKSSTSRPKLENSCGQARKGKKKQKGASKRHHG